MATNLAKRNRKREARLPIVAKMMSRGAAVVDIQSELKKELGVEITDRTIYNDMKYLKEKWQEEEHENITTYVKQELKRIDEIIWELWKKWEQSCKDYERTITRQYGEPNSRGEIETTRVERVTEEVKGAGNVNIIAEIRHNLIERRKLLGLYQQNDYTADVKLASIIGDFLNTANDK